MLTNDTCGHLFTENLSVDSHFFSLKAMFRRKKMHETCFGS